MDPAGIGEGISLADPCVLVAFLRGVWLTVPVVPVVAVVPLVPDCWQEAKTAMTSGRAIRENICFFIGYTFKRATQSLWLSKTEELFGIVALLCRAAADTGASHIAVRALLFDGLSSAANAAPARGRSASCHLFES